MFSLGSQLLPLLVPLNSNTIRVPYAPCNLAAGAERLLHPGDDVRGVQVGRGDGPRDAHRQPAPRRRAHRHERALLPLPRRLPGHRGERASEHQPDPVIIRPPLLQSADALSNHTASILI